VELVKIYLEVVSKLAVCCPLDIKDIQMNRQSCWELLFETWITSCAAQKNTKGIDINLFAMAAN
jgi:hypothetical protein